MLATSLTGQIAAQRGDGRHAACLHFNVAGAEGGSASDKNSDRGGGGGDKGGGGRDGSRVAAVAWLSPALGTFAAGHVSGMLYIYQKRVGQVGVWQIAKCRIVPCLDISHDH